MCKNGSLKTGWTSAPGWATRQTWDKGSKGPVSQGLRERGLPDFPSLTQPIPSGTSWRSKHCWSERTPGQVWKKIGKLCGSCPGRQLGFLRPLGQAGGRGFS
jgi:hypothetical protein